MDLATGDIICSELSPDDVGDTTALPELLDQIDRPVSRFLADGAYDGTPTDDLLKARFSETVEIIIPPPKNAALSSQSAHDPTFRDQRITEIQARGRMAKIMGKGDLRLKFDPCNTAASVRGASDRIVSRLLPPNAYYRRP